MSTQVRHQENPVLEVEVAFYERERDKLAADYPGRYLLIYGDRLVGDFATLGEATTEGVRRFGAGPFLARLAGADEPVSTTTSIF